MKVIHSRQLDDYLVPLDENHGMQNGANSRKDQDFQWNYTYRVQLVGKKTWKSNHYKLEPYLTFYIIKFIFTF